MEITWLGHSSFRIKGKNVVCVTDPFSPSMTGLKFPKVEADLVTISHDHEDHNQKDLVDNVSYVISGPGEYEIKGASVFGFPTFHDNQKGALRGKNTVYVIEIDKIRICHLGDLGHKLDEDILEDLDGVDILMIPVGGGPTLGPAEAVSVITQIEPKIILPMHYNEPGLNQAVFSSLLPLEAFLKEAGDQGERMPKLQVSAENLTEEKQQFIILERKNA